MSEENNICEICGGVKRIEYVIGFENGMPRDMRVEPQDLPQTAWRLCPGHPEPAPKHGGDLGHGDVVSYDRYHQRPVHVKVFVDSDEIMMAPDIGEIAISPRKALSLLRWLEQERDELERLAKEQEQG